MTARPITHGDDRQSLQVVHFTVATGRSAVDIMRVKEIINPIAVTPVPKAPPFIEGIIELRGSILPIVDLRKRFDLPATPLTRESKYIIGAVDDRIVGLIVDRVSEVDRVSPEEVRPAPDLALGAGTQFVAGVYKRGEQIVMLVDVDQILTPGEKDELRRLGDA